MKTIQVTDEMYDFLMDLSKQINSQDHRGTRMPYFFQVQETKEVATGDGMGDKIWVMDGEVCLRTNEDIKEAVFEWKEWELGNDDDENEYDILNEYEIEDILKNNYAPYDVTTEHVYTNSFLTSKACQDHIDRNHYHYSNPINYLSYASRNPELEKVMQFLCELTGGKLHK